MAIITIGIDLAKYVFALHGVNVDGLLCWHGVRRLDSTALPQWCRRRKCETARPMATPASRPKPPLSRASLING